MNISTINYLGHAEVVPANIGNRVTLYSQVAFPNGSNRHGSNGGRGTLCLTHEDVLELVSLIVLVKKETSGPRAKPFTVSHEGENYSCVKIFWLDCGLESYCLFNTLDLLIQLKPDMIARYLMNLKFAKKAARSRTR